MKPRLAPGNVSRTNLPALADVRFIGPEDKGFCLSSDLKRFLHTLLRLLLKALNQKSASILLLDQQGEFLHRVASLGLSTRYKRKVPKIRVAAWPIWKEITKKGMFWLSSVAVDPHNLTRDELREEGIITLRGVPLTAAGSTIGLLTIFFKEKSQFSKETQDLLQFVGALIGMAIERVKLREEERKTSDFLKGLHKVSLEILSVRDSQKLLGKILVEAKRIIAADRVVLRLKMPSGKFAKGVSVGIRVPFLDSEPNRFRGTAGLAVKTGEVQWTDNYAGDSRARANPNAEALIKHGLVSGIASPMKSKGKVTGLLIAVYTHSKRFSEQDKFMMSTLANQAALAINNAGLYSRLATRADELVRLREEEKKTSDFLKVLHKVSLEILSVRDSQKLLGKILVEAKRIMTADRVSLRLKMPSGEFAKGVSVGIGVPFLDSGARRFGGIAGLAIKTGEVQWTDNYAGDSRTRGNPNAEALIKHGIVSGIASPMKSKGKVTGVLIAQHTHSKRFSEQDKFMISTLANQAALAINNAGLYSRLATRADELVRLREEEKKTSDFLKVLHKVSLEILSVRDSQKLLGKILVEAKRIMTADRMTLRLKMPGGEFARQLAVGINGRISDADLIKSKHTLFQHAIKSRKIQWSENFFADQGLLDEPIIKIIMKRGLVSGIACPMKSKAKVTGCLIALYTQPKRFSKQDEFVMSTFANQAAVAIENARLYQSLKDKEQRLKAFVNMLINAQEEERKRVARDIHDELAQILVSSAQHFSIVNEELPTLPLASKHEFQTGLDRLKLSIETVRRLISGLRPHRLDSLGLVKTLEDYLREQAKESRWQLDFVQNLGNLRFPSNLETGVYRIVQEAVTNVRKHAGSKRVQVKLTKEKETLSVKVQDWGQGFVVQRVREREKCLGLLGMSERAAMLGGSCNCFSTQGKGTRVEVKIPL